MNPPDYLWLFVRMVIVLVVVLGLALFLIRYVLGRNGKWRKGQRTGWAHVVGQVMLGPRKGLYLLRVAGRYLVVGSTENSLSLLAELSREEGERIEKT